MTVPNAQQALGVLNPDLPFSVIPTDAAAGWNIAIFDRHGNALTTDQIGLVVAHNPKMGVSIGYGMTRSKYDGFLIRETGGGGSVTAMYAIINGHVYVGVLEQDRFTQGGKILNCARGYRNPGESAFGTAVREFKEETGLQLPALMTYELKGSPVNPNSAHYMTAEDGEGVRFYACRLPLEIIELRGGEYRIKQSVIDRASEEDRRKEGIFGIKLIPWQKAMLLQDGFSVIATARLITDDRTNKRKFGWDAMLAWLRNCPLFW
jgi:ADP-ribose pyrophosphatase YjhB (NUDIX family)